MGHKLQAFPLFTDFLPSFSKLDLFSIASGWLEINISLRNTATDKIQTRPNKPRFMWPFVMFIVYEGVIIYFSPKLFSQPESTKCQKTNINQWFCPRYYALLGSFWYQLKRQSIDCFAFQGNYLTNLNRLPRRKL